MSLRYCSLNSGSNGNCYWVGTHENAVLIDLGISCRELEKRLAELQLDVLQVRALFVSHEHIDHVKGVLTFAKRYRVPVYGNKETLQAANLTGLGELCRIIESNESIEIGPMLVHPFAKFHDAALPISFSVECEQARVAVITDIGHACKEVKNHVELAHAIILEANYDEKMLKEGHYPLHLKRRIAGNHGHLSNADALQLFREKASADLQHLILGHLSAENNDPDLVYDLFYPHCRKVKLTIASRDEASPLFELKPVVKRPSGQKIKPMPHLQLSLF